MVNDPHPLLIWQHTDDADSTNFHRFYPWISVSNILFIIDDYL